MFIRTVRGPVDVDAFAVFGTVPPSGNRAGPGFVRRWHRDRDGETPTCRCRPWRSRILRWQADRRRTGSSTRHGLRTCSRCRTARSSTPTEALTGHRRLHEDQRRDGLEIGSVEIDRGNTLAADRRDVGTVDADRHRVDRVELREREDHLRHAHLHRQAAATGLEATREIHRRLAVSDVHSEQARSWRDHGRHADLGLELRRASEQGAECSAGNRGRTDRAPTGSRSSRGGRSQTRTALAAGLLRDGGRRGGRRRWAVVGGGGGRWGGGRWSGGRWGGGRWGGGRSGCGRCPAPPT